MKVERDAPVLVAVGSLNCLLKLCIGLHRCNAHTLNRSPTKKCAGVSGCGSSSSLWTKVRGLEFSVASTSVRSVDISSK